MAKSQKSKNQKFFSISEFNFDFDASCDCEVDTSHPMRDVVKNTIRLYPNSSKHCYFYKHGKELYSTNADGKGTARAVLPDLLEIKDNKDIKKFIERHGFPLPFEPDEDNSLESEVLFSFIHRLDATINLMAALSEDSNDHMKILALTLYLLLTPPTIMEFTNGWSQYSTCRHEMTRVWNNLDTIEHRVLRPEDEGYDCSKGCYVYDTVRPPEIFLSDDEYFSIIYSNNPDEFEFDKTNVKSISIYLFRNAVQVGAPCRLAIDFLYHFTKEIGDILNWDYTGKLTLRYSSNNDTINEKLDEPLKFALNKLAKQTLKAEIDWSASNITPSYNVETFAPAWSVSDLLSGMYFALFNIRAEEESYRVCAKPNCGRYFLAKIDSIKQKYCSHSCSNAEAQSVHRSKKKNSITANSDSLPN